MIYKTVKRNNYQVIDNTVFTLPVSIEARCLLAYMLSKPADWNFKNKAICNEFGITEGKLKKKLKELKDYGLVVKTRHHVNGKYEWTTEVYESLDLVNKGSNSIGSNSTDSKTADILSTDNDQVLNKTNISELKEQTQELHKLLGNTGTIRSDYTPQLRRRLKTFSYDEIKQTALNIKNNEFMAENNHNTLDFLLKSDKQLEKWLVKKKLEVPKWL